MIKLNAEEVRAVANIRKNHIERVFKRFKDHSFGEDATDDRDIVRTMRECSLLCWELAEAGERISKIEGTNREFTVSEEMSSFLESVRKDGVGA